MKLIALILVLAPVFAQEPAALAIGNVRYDAKKATVDFDVSTAAGAKPVHSWLITVGLGDGTSMVTPKNCSAAGHCTASVDFGGGNAASSAPDVRVSVVLFEDGTASGDLKMLQSEIDDARLRLRALEAWQKDFDRTPSDIAYTSAVMNEREIVKAFAAKETAPQRAAMLQARVNMARERARLFPAHNPPYAPAEAVASNRAITDDASLFPIVYKEERGGQLRLVLRNNYEKEIVAFAFTERQPDGTLMRSSNGHAIPPDGLQEFEYGPAGAGSTIELSCVMFKDGSADGDPVVVRKMREGWAGRKAELARILPLLRAVANLPAGERAAATEKLIADLKAHPQEEPDANHSIDFVLGQQAERKAALRDLRDLPIEESIKDLQE